MKPTEFPQYGTKLFDVYFYHNNCTDGMTAMAIAYQHIPGGAHHTVVPCDHGYKQWNYDFVKGKKVCFLDFSFSKDTMQRIVDLASEVTIIDHHVSCYEDNCSLVGDNVRYIYDVNMSGAGLAWNYFFNGDMPYLVELVQDRDIWTKLYDDTEALAVAIRAKNYDLADMKALIAKLVEESMYQKFGSGQEEVQRLILAGEAMLEYKLSVIKSIASMSYDSTLDDGTACRKVCCPPGLSSDVGAHLAQRYYGVAWMYYEVEDGILNSLRVSAKCDYDASAYAKSQGGGGHAKAAGWKVKRETPVNVT